MKKLTIALAALALFSTASFASREHCVTRTIVANYVGGSMTSTQCFDHEGGTLTKATCEKRS